ncbi:hypothetical protein Goari_021285, partial [Gossypium aridum]|nr:hypothetical protein [Gossypium aridum]
MPWRFNGPQQICFFLWLALKRRLLKNVERTRRGIRNSITCGLCGHEYEDMLRVLRDCSAAKIIWDKLIPEKKQSRFYIDSLHNWMTINLQNHFSISLDGVDWPCLFGIIAWHSNWVSLRTNGSVRLDEGFAAAGGFVCDHNDGWIMGFYRYLGNCTVVEAELWGILNSLNLILDRWFERVLILTDSIEAVNAIQE